MQLRELFAANPHHNLMHAGFEFLAALRQTKSEFPESVPYPLYYEPGGLLPWGISIDGDLFCWSTRGLSGHWTVTIIGHYTDNEEFPLTGTVWNSLICIWITTAIWAEQGPLAFQLLFETV